MPLELGVFLGAKKYGGPKHRQKSCIIFDRERYRFQRYISDIAGQDIHAHKGDARILIRELATWLRAHSHDANIPWRNRHRRRICSFHRGVAADIFRETTRSS